MTAAETIGLSTGRPTCASTGTTTASSDHSAHRGAATARIDPTAARPTASAARMYPRVAPACGQLLLDQRALVQIALGRRLLEQPGQLRVPPPPQLPAGELPDADDRPEQRQRHVQQRQPEAVVPGPVPGDLPGVLRRLLDAVPAGVSCGNALSGAAHRSLLSRWCGVGVLISQRDAAPFPGEPPPCAGPSPAGSLPAAPAAPAPSSLDGAARPLDVPLPVAVLPAAAPALA
jgi:hypothetical protein